MVNINPMITKGKSMERNSIKALFKKRYDIKEILHDLNNEYRHHIVAIKNPYLFRVTRYKFSLGSESPLLNRVYAEQFVEMYGRRSIDLLSSLEIIEAALFDITEGKF